MATEILHMSEADLAKDVQAALQRVEAGAEVVIERDTIPVAVLRKAEPPFGRLSSECIALAEQHERETGYAPTLDPEFADILEEIINNRKPRRASPFLFPTS